MADAAGHEKSIDLSLAQTQLATGNKTDRAKILKNMGLQAYLAGNRGGTLTSNLDF
jgi:hypothetical protein